MKEETMTGNGKAMTTNESTLPPLYRKPVPLSSETHAKFSLRETVDYSIAKQATSLMINVVEFSSAAHCYPIIFSGTDTLVPLVITGLHKDENLFVDNKGQWLQDYYIPAYVRRYPFVLMEDVQRKQMILGIDEDTSLLVESDVRPLFDKNGDKSTLTDRALTFCAAFQREFETTKIFTEALKEKDLLIERNARVRLATGEDIVVGGMKIIDEEKFNALPDDVYMDWRKKNWIGLIYCHFFSLSNWTHLARIASESTGSKNTKANKK